MTDAVLERLPPDLRPLAATLLPRRVARMLDVLDRRLGSVVLVVEAVRKRHNVSAILRTADAFGLHEVHLVSGGFRPSHGAARGSERWLHLVRCPSIAASVSGLRTRGFRIAVADLGPACWTPETVPVDRPLAILFGSELTGVSAEAHALADGTVHVPMHGFVESLNVSVAAALVTRSVAERRRAVAGADLDPVARRAALEAWVRRESTWMSAARVRHGLDPPPGT
ncbi:MAG: RNA methyltransferase [Deltaproteobacteria bacterium]|nr:RNA methyltransferase [Deltaproteobacteria bacterium]